MSFSPADTTTDVNAEWRDEANCTSKASEIYGMGDAWIDEDHPLRQYAEEICNDCPVRFLCGLDAVQDPSAEGLRAGFYFSNGRVPHTESRRMQEELGLKPRSRQKTRRSRAAS